MSTASVGKPFICHVPGCKSGFHTDAARLQHMGDAHSRSKRPTAVNSKNAYACGVSSCTLSFTSQDALKQHGLDSHRSSKNAYKCGVPNCNRSFSMHAELVQHTKDSHPKVSNTKNITVGSTPNSPNHPNQNQHHHFRQPSLDSIWSLAAHFGSSLIPEGPLQNIFNPGHGRINEEPYGNAQIPVAQALTNSTTSPPTHVAQDAPFDMLTPQFDVGALLQPFSHLMQPNPSSPQVSIHATAPRVYKKLASLLEAKLSEMTANNNLRDRMRVRIGNMIGLDVASSLAESSQYRLDLLEFANELKCDQFDILQALEEDDKDISHLLRYVLNSVSEQTQVLKLEEDKAQQFIVLLDAKTFGNSDSEFCRSARNMKNKLYKAGHELSPTLFVQGVALVGDGHPVGQGGFAEIFKGMYKGRAVALKRMRAYDNGDHVKKMMIREITAWERLENPYVLPFFGLDDKTFPCPPFFPCIVTQWMKNGTIHNYIKQYAPSRSNVDRLLFEIAQGLAYLHSEDVIHGDLRGTNILIDDSGHPRLADFGLASFAEDALPTQSSLRDGSVRWMAPELLEPKYFELGFKRTKATDMYALGCTYLEIYTGEAPFSGLKDMAVALQVLNEGKRPERPSGSKAISDEKWNLIGLCWAQEPSKRRTIKQLLDAMGNIDFGGPW